MNISSRFLKKYPTYKFKELKNAAPPYFGVVHINEVTYGQTEAKVDAKKNVKNVHSSVEKKDHPDSSQKI